MVKDYNTNLQSINLNLQTILNTINNLPEAGGTDTTDATATASDILSGKTAYVSGQKITGNIAFAPAKTITPSITSQIAISSGYYASGNITVAAVPTQTKSATPTSSTQNITPDSGKFLSQVTVAGDSNLIAGNIKKGTSIFGVTGDYEGSGNSDEVDYSMEDGLVDGSGSVYVNDRVTKIRSYAFASCIRLTSVNFPNCSYIGSYAFSSCTVLTSINFPICLYIGAYAFYPCSGLTSVNFPNCSYIGNYAFSGCSNLISISFPVCSYIGKYAFYRCLGLTSVNFPICSYIGNNAFINCSSLTSVDFGGDSAISKCSIYVSAFASCMTLTNLTLRYSFIATLSNINVFTSTPMSLSTLTGSFGSIYVPASLVDSYKAATNWATYADRITAIVE